MNIQAMTMQIKNHPEAEKIGMIVSHLGIVRGHSRENEKVSAVQVAYHRKTLVQIINEMRKKTGIVEVLVEFNEGQIEIGGDLLAVVVAGDLRENVFPVLIETVNRIKSSACQKKEIIKQDERQ
jgi:molybdopterin synthase catalytic subunit